MRTVQSPGWRRFCARPVCMCDQTHRCVSGFRFLRSLLALAGGTGLLMGVVHGVSTQPTFEWVQVASGRGGERMTAVSLDASDHALVVGSFSEVLQMGDELRYSVAESDVFAAKVNSNGALVWLTPLTSGLSDTARAVVPDGAGGCLVSWGESLSRLGADGTLQWTRTFWDSVGTFGVVAVDAGTAVVLVKEPDGQFSVRQVELELGEDRWVRPLGLDADSAQLVRDDGGNLWVSGVARGTLEVEDQRFRLPPGTVGTVVVLKLNPEGALQWIRFAEGAQRMDLRSFKAFPGGRVLAAGAASSRFTLGGVQLGQTNGVQHGWAAVLEPDGSCRWQWGDQGIEVTAAAALGTNEVVLARTVLGVGTELRRVHAETGAEWTVYGAAVQVSDVVARPNGSVWVAGRYQGTSGLGTRPFDPPILGDDGVFLARRRLIAPMILLDPQSTTNVAGTFVRLQPEIDDANGRVQYQWYKNDQLLPGATNAILDFPEVTLADMGGYTVAITNVDGGTNSAMAQVAVRFSLQTGIVGEGRVEAQPAGSVFDPGATVMLRASPGDGQEFVGWVGDVPATAVTANPLRLVMDRNRRLMAQFRPVPRLVTSAAPDGSDRLRLVGPEGVPAVLEASEDLKTWRPVLMFQMSSQPVELGNLLPSASKTFYRLDVK